MENRAVGALYEKRWFLVLCFYLSVDLARIQQVIPGLSSIRPGLITTLALILCLLGSKQVRLVFSFPQIKRTFLFIVLLFTYIPFAEGARVAFLATVGMLLYLPFIFSCVLIINSKDKLLYICKVYVFILLFVCCYALLHGGSGPGGSINDENDLCLFIVCLLPLTLFVFVQEQKKLFRLFWLLVVLISLATIVTTFSRGGFIGMIVMGGVYWWFNKRKILILFCAIILGCGMLYFGGDIYQKEMSTVTDTSDNTANERLLTWKAAMKMFLDHPFGVGGNNFPRHFPEYQTEELARNMWGRAAHSLWFTLIPETGVIGIVLYLSIIFQNFKDIFFIRQFHWAEHQEEKKFFDAISLSLLAALFGFYAAGTFISVLYYPMFWYLTALVVCMRNVHSGVSAEMLFKD